MEEPLAVVPGSRTFWIVAGSALFALVGLVLMGLGLAGKVAWIEGGATLLGGFLVALCAVGLASWLIPRAQVARWKDAGIDDAVKLAELTNSSRTTVTQAAAGIGLILTLTLTAYQVNETRRSSDRNVRIAEEGQVTERFSRAVEQLGATKGDGTPAIEIRIGGLFSLLRIGHDSDRDTVSAFLVAAQYVKSNVTAKPATRARNAGPCDAARTPLRADVAAALEYVLPPLALDLERQFGVGDLGYLSGLERSDFSGTDLGRVYLRGVWLRNASFRAANLEHATFERVMLENVDFREACLLDADLRRTEAVGSVDLRGADIRGARLSDEVRGHAITDQSTRR